MLDNDRAGRKGSETRSSACGSSPATFLNGWCARDGIEALAARYREAERRIEALADAIDHLRAELDKLPAGSSLASASEPKLQALARQMENETAAIRESAGHPLPYDVDPTCCAARLAGRLRSPG